MGYAKTILPNGIRVISESVPAVGSVAVGIWIHVGSRDESEKVNGVSHFIEHMLFKGTKKRSAFEIARALEALGGSINAFTSREHTCYYVRILGNHLPRAMEILSDILNNASFSPPDIRKERQVILEEIKDISDSPSELVHDLFVEQMWNAHPLGQPVIGTAKSVRALRRTAALNFLQSHYCSPNIVIAGTGDLSHRKLVDLARKYFKWPGCENSRAIVPPDLNGMRIAANIRRSKQAHVCIGFPTFGYPDSQRFILTALNAYLSSGMSARLFQKVREEAGFCYNIYSYLDFFRDTGYFCVYFSADKKYVRRATNIILKELRRLKEERLNRAELGKIKEQLKGMLMLSQESMYNRMSRIASQELLLESYIDLERHRRIIDSISDRQILEMANRIFDRDRLTCCSLGPTTKKELNSIRWSKL